MNILVLGRGKTGSLVIGVARERGHEVSVLTGRENPRASALTPERLSKVNVVLDFTTPDAVLDNIFACIRSKTNIVVGTTGWYKDLSKVKQEVENGGMGLLYSPNFFIGVNILFDAARTAAAALHHGYFGQIFERHHAQKKDAPSGTALMLGKTIKEASGTELEIISFREGDVIGMHEVVLDSPNDTIYLCHDSKSRRGFAEGAVRAAEWLAEKKGFFDFKDVWREL
jgi:4-hydroxy-tetrahydrodipicolinate reductase